MLDFVFGEYHDWEVYSLVFDVQSSNAWVFLSMVGGEVSGLVFDE